MKKELKKMKKFRFQLLSQWLVENHVPCKAADVGGGKGVLALMLKQQGWSMVIIDPGEAGKAPKYRDPQSGEQIQLTRQELTSVPKIQRPFEMEMAKDFDLLIGLHVHGSNMKIIDAAAKYDKDFIIFPCCVIDEPIVPRPNVNWLDSLEDYAVTQGHAVNRVELNFKGQNIGLCNFKGARS